MEVHGGVHRGTQGMQMYTEVHKGMWRCTEIHRAMQRICGGMQRGVTPIN